MAEFASGRPAGDPPLSTEHRVLHVDQQRDHATALLYRRMSIEASPPACELRLRKERGRWQVSGRCCLAR